MPTANGVELCRLVDAVSGSPSVVLDLNTSASPGLKPTASEWYLRPPGPQLNPPPLRRTFPQTLLVDGSAPPAAAFDNRVIVLPLRLDVPKTATNPEAVKASKLGALAAALNAVRPVLQFQPRTSAAATFYRLYRSPSIEVDRWSPTDGVLDVTATIVAEPFGYGTRVEVGATTQDNANPYFETNVANWTPTGCTAVRSTAQAHQGSASMLITPGGGATPHVDSEQVGDGSLIAGRGFRATGWLYSPGGYATGVGVRINWYDAAHVYISTSAGTSAIAAATWTFYDTGVVFAPAGAVYRQVIVSYAGTPTAGQTLHADEVLVWATGAYQVTNDPAAAVQGCLLDVTGVAGDVETPALLLLDPGAGAPFAPIISTRRRGDPANDIQPFVQAEAMTLGTDTTVVNPITGFSNGQGTRTTFATATMVTRLTSSVPYTSGFPRAGARGTYRIWVALKPSNTSSTFKLRFRVNEFLGGTDLVVSDTITWSPLSTNRCLVDLGLLQVPIGADPAGAGYGPAPTIQSVALELQMQRSAGAGTMDVDYLAVLPADTEYARIGRSGVDLTLDGPQDMVYTINDGNAGLTSDGVAIPSRTGFLPMLSPAQTSRIYLIRPQNAGAGAVTDLDDVTNTLAVTVSYWPRYLTWAP